MSELIQATHGRVGAAPRLADITGIIGLTSLGVNPHIWADVTVSAAIVVLVAAAWIGARRGLRLAALEQYVLFSAVLVTAMMFSPSEWYEHYAAFAGPFLMLLTALSATARRRQEAIGWPDARHGRSPRGGGARSGYCGDGGGRRHLGHQTAPAGEPGGGEGTHPARRVRAHRYGLGHYRHRPIQRRLARLPADRRTLSAR